MRAQCCICSDLFQICQTVNIAAVPCGHTFHEDCLLRWMETSSTCPSCRAYVKRNQIIRRLFFDIEEDNNEDADADELLNKINDLKAQVREKDEQRQEIAESRVYYFTKFAAAEADRVELQAKLNEEKEVREILQRDLSLLQKENSAFVEEIKELRKAQNRLQELQNVETLLTGCDSDIQHIVSQYSEADESSIKQLASLLTVLKREYNKVLADKKTLREQMFKMEWSVGQYHSKAHKFKMETKELKTDLEKTQEALRQVEKENNENRRKLVHLRNALQYSKTVGSQNFHRALNEDIANVAYTPPEFLGTAHDLNDDEENDDRNHCLTPDLFEESSKLNWNYLKRRCLEELHGQEVQYTNVSTAAKRFKSGKLSSPAILADDQPKIPHDMQNNDGFGGSETFVHTQGQSSVPLKLDSKNCIGRQNSQTIFRLLLTLLAVQPQINSCVQSRHSLSSSSSSLSSMEEIEDSRKLNSKAQALTDKPRKKDAVYGVGKLSSFLTMKATASSSSSSLKNTPELSQDDFIDLT